MGSGDSLSRGCGEFVVILALVCAVLLPVMLLVYFCFFGLFLNLSLALWSRGKSFVSLVANVRLFTLYGPLMLYRGAAVASDTRI